MASLLKALRLQGNHSTDVAAEMRDLANRARDERRRLEDVIARARGAATEVTKLTAPVARMEERVAALEKQVSAIEKLAPHVTALRAQADALHQAQRRMDAQLAESADRSAHVQAQLEEMKPLMEAAVNLKQDLTRFLEVEGPVKTLKSQADDLQAQLGELTGNFARLRDRQEDLAGTSKKAAARIEAVEAAAQAATKTVDEYQRRVGELEQGLARLSQLAAATSDTKHQLLMLKSLADQVTQKVTALESQRDAIERASQDVSRLDDLVHRVDTAIRVQEDQLYDLKSTANDVDDLRSLYDSVAARSEEIRTRQQQVDEYERATRQRLTELGDQLRKAVEHVDLESRGLDVATQRVADLRRALTECEDRMNTLGTSGRAVDEVRAKTVHLASRLESAMSALPEIDRQTERVHVLRADADRLEEVVRGLSPRLAEIEKAKPAVDSLLRDIATLGRSHEAMKETLAQMRLAHAEMSRMRETQIGTETWLTSAQESMAQLRDGVAALSTARPGVESLQRDVEHVLEAMEVVKARRQFFDGMQTQLAELASLGAQLDDRSKALRLRMDLAEGRFHSVARQAEDSERITSLVSGVAQTVTSAESKITDLTRSVAFLETRSQRLESAADRARLLGEEMEQCQVALDRATEHLARVSGVRQEAAEAAQQLDERARTLQTLLGGVEERATRLGAMAEQLETRVARLGMVEKRIAGFEEQLGKWRMVEVDLRRALDQVTGRQATVDALETNIRHMFELAERTTNDAKTVVGAQREIQESKAALDDLLLRSRDVEAMLSKIEERQQQIEDAEGRLARADALLTDIQASLEALHSQKAVVDHVVDRVASLSAEAQQAEALIDRLREERDITSRARAALEDVRKGGGRRR
jgi:chromosome segregation ATPase